MKRKILITFIVLISIQVNCQIRRGISPFRFNPSMYIGANVGPNIFVGEGVGQYLLKGSIGLSESIFLGYNFSEIIGARVMGSFNTMSWPQQPVTSSNKSFSTMKMSIEGLLNVTNIFNYYNLNRPIDIVVFGGLGLISREKGLYQNEYIGPVLKGGGQIDFRINYKFDINANFTANIVSDKFNEYVTGTNFDAFPEFKLGVTYHLRYKSNYR